MQKPITETKNRPQVLNVLEMEATKDENGKLQIKFDRVVPDIIKEEKYNFCKHDAVRGFCKLGC